MNNLHIITLYKLHNQLSYVSSQLSSSCRARRVERVEPCCSTCSTQPKFMGSTRRTCRVVSCRDVTSQVEFGLIVSAAFSAPLFCPSVRLRNDLYCVVWGVKLYTLTHSLCPSAFLFVDMSVFHVLHDFIYLHSFRVPCCVVQINK